MGRNLNWDRRTASFYNRFPIVFDPEKANNSVLARSLVTGINFKSHQEKKLFLDLGNKIIEDLWSKKVSQEEINNWKRWWKKSISLRDWSDPLGVSAWMNREAKYYTVEALNLVTYFLDGAIDALMWLMETTDELSNKLDKES